MRVLPRHPGTMALAVVLAALVWYAQALERRERISERQLEASVTFVNVPAEMVITSEVPRNVVLRVRGPLSRLRQLDPTQVGVVIDLRGAREGDRDLTVENRNVIVPPGVEVLAVSPSEMPLRLERLIRRRLSVKPRLTGEPAAGLVAGIALSQPATVRVVGPRLLLETLQGVTTEPIALDGAEGPVEATVAVRSPNSLVRIEDPLVVRVVVEILPARGDTRGGRRK